MVGASVGSYRVVRLLGEGGMGSVYEAVNEAIERRVAIKILHAEYVRQPDVITRFFNEARAVNRIAHPSVVQIHEFGHLSDGTAFIIMEYLEGQTLGERLRQCGGRLALRTALQVAWQVAAALAAAHAKNIIHRDLKPANLMLVADPLGPGGERVKLLDFGIAKVRADARGQQTASQLIMGTPSYMSPEQCRGAGSVDDKSDSYALGVILYEMLCGRPPFIGQGPGETMAMHMYQPPPPVQQWTTEVPADIAAYILGLLNKEPGQRPAMSQVFQRLSELATTYAAVSSTAAHEVTRFVQSVRPQDGGATMVSIDPSTIESRGQKRGGPRRAPSFLLALGLGGLVAWGAWLFLRTADAPTAARSPRSGVDGGRSRDDEALRSSSSRGDANLRDTVTPTPTASRGATGRVATPSSRSVSPVQPGLSPRDADVRLSQAQSEYVNGHYARAIELARYAVSRQPLRAWRIIGSASCQLRDTVHVNEAYRHLDLAGRRYLSQVCARNGLLNVGNPSAAVRLVE